MTKQKRIILEEIKKLTTHPTADELYHRVRRHIPHISLGTIYRNLDHLCRDGVVGKLDAAGGERRYDGNVTPHYHLRCECCNRIEDLFGAEPEEIRTLAESVKNYQITGFRLEITGICPECRKTR